MKVIESVPFGGVMKFLNFFNTARGRMITAAAVTAAAIASASLLYNMNSGSSAVCSSLVPYIKDNSLFAVSSDGEINVQLTENSSGRILSENDIKLMSENICISEDNSRIVFIRNISQQSSLFEICSADVQSGEEPVLIAENAAAFYSDCSAQKIIYLKKSSDGSFDLFGYSKGSSSLIEKDISFFYADRDAEYILCIKESRCLVMRSGKVTADLGRCSILYFDESLDRIYYRDENSDLYCLRNKKTAVRLFSGAAGIIKIYDSGEIFFLRPQISRIFLAGCIFDDMSEADAAVSEPSLPSAPLKADYPDQALYEEALVRYRRANAFYESEYKKYEAKLSRDRLRKDLSEEPFEILTYELCFFDGSRVTAADSSFSCLVAAGETRAVVVYSSSSEISDFSVKLSEINSRNEIESSVMNRINASSELKVSSGGRSYPFPCQKAFNVQIPQNSSKIYYMISGSEITGNQLFELNISEDKLLEGSVLYDGVLGCFVRGNILVCEKNGRQYEILTSTGAGTSEVSVRQAENFSGPDTLIYISGMNDSGTGGTLKILRNERTEKTAENVHSFYILENMQLAVLADFADGRGNIYCGNEKRLTKTAENVSCILEPRKRSRMYKGYREALL